MVSYSSVEDPTSTPPVVDKQVQLSETLFEPSFHPQVLGEDVGRYELGRSSFPNNEYE